MFNIYNGNTHKSIVLDEADGADVVFDGDDGEDRVHIRGVRPGAWQQPSTGLLKDRPKRQQLNALINSVLLVVKEK